MSDLVDRHAALNALIYAVKNVGVLDAGDIRTVFKALPTIQPIATDTNVGDTISRQAAIDSVDAIGHIATMPDGDKCIRRSAVKYTLSMLPPAQPEPKEGHWILHESPDGGEQYECSLCGVLWEFNDGTPEDNEAYFCPKCGTKMKGERQK